MNTKNLLNIIKAAIISICFFYESHNIDMSDTTGYNRQCAISLFFRNKKDKNILFLQQKLAEITILNSLKTQSM